MSLNHLTTREDPVWQSLNIGASTISSQDYYVKDAEGFETIFVDVAKNVTASTVTATTITATNVAATNVTTTNVNTSNVFATDVTASMITDSGKLVLPLSEAVGQITVDNTAIQFGSYPPGETSFAGISHDTAGNVSLHASDGLLTANTNIYRFMAGPIAEIQVKVGAGSFGPFVGLSSGGPITGTIIANLSNISAVGSISGFYIRTNNIVDITAQIVVTVPSNLSPFGFSITCDQMNGLLAPNANAMGFGIVPASNIPVGILSGGALNKAFATFATPAAPLAGVALVIAFKCIIG